MANLTDAQAKLLENLELEMMSDMYNRMTNACKLKCVVPKYNDVELSKAEAVCLDRCVAKYMEVHDKIGTKLTAMNQEAAAAGGTVGQMQPPNTPAK